MYRRPARPPYQSYATNAQEEATYDFVEARKVLNMKRTNKVESVTNAVKGALGGGILSSHVAYKKAGVALALPLNVVGGIYMTFCLYLLVKSAQVLYQRTRTPQMSYADVGEAAAALCPSKIVKKCSKLFRYSIDFVICMDLFGSCACYQIIIGKTIKQLVEDTHLQTVEGIAGYPHLRVYMACMIPVIILICLIRHLKYLAPFSMAANFMILLCIFTSIYYAFVNNPHFENMRICGDDWEIMQSVGMIVFSMSCVGVVLPLENHLKNPYELPLVLISSMACIILCTCCAAMSGYVAFLDKSEAPITVNYPMGPWPKFLKAGVALMILVTHGLNFWVPFDLCFYYIKQRIPEEKEVFWELIFRACFATCIGLVAIMFPDISALMGFIGTFCLSNMAFIFPCMIYLMVVSDRPGMGKFMWRLWGCLFLIIVGTFILCVGSVVNFIELIEVFRKVNTKK